MGRRNVGGERERGGGREGGRDSEKGKKGWIGGETRSESRQEAGWLAGWPWPGLEVCTLRNGMPIRSMGIGKWRIQVPVSGIGPMGPLLCM